MNDHIKHIIGQLLCVRKHCLMKMNCSLNLLIILSMQTIHLFCELLLFSYHPMQRYQCQILHHRQQPKNNLWCSFYLHKYYFRSETVRSVWESIQKFVKYNNTIDKLLFQKRLKLQRYEFVICHNLLRLSFCIFNDKVAK